MALKTEKINIDEILNLYPHLKSSNVEILVNIENRKESERIKTFIRDKGKKKFIRIVYEILNNRYNDSLYKKIEQHITEMRFTGKWLGDQRIYCSESSKNGKKVVMMFLRKKKQNAIKDDGKLKGLIEIIRNKTQEDGE